MKSCYEAGRDGFWLHRFLESRGIENFVIDSASIEVKRRSKRAKTDRLDVNGLVDLLARHLAGSRKPVFSVLTVPSEQAEDLRQLGRELKLVKRDRTRVSNRIKGLLANQGLLIDRSRDMTTAARASLRLWNGSKLPHHLRARLERYVSDYGYYTARIKELDRERKAVLRVNEGEATEKVWRLLWLRGVGIETAWCYGMEFFGWRRVPEPQAGGFAGRADADAA